MSALAKITVDGKVTRVAAALREAVLSGVISPGAQLVVASLAEQLGTSKGSVREAIRELVAEGLLEHHLHRGTFVREFSAEECVDLYLSRTVIEVWAAQQILKLDDPDFSEMERALGNMSVTKKAANESSVEVIDADMDFHRSLVAMGASRRMSELHESLLAETTLMVRARRPFATADHYPVHAELLEALRNRDSAAPDQLSAHLKDARTRMTQLVTV